MVRNHAWSTNNASISWCVSHVSESTKKRNLLSTIIGSVPSARRMVGITNMLNPFMLDMNYHKLNYSYSSNVSFPYLNYRFFGENFETRNLKINNLKSIMFSWYPFNLALFHSTYSSNFDHYMLFVGTIKYLLTKNNL